MFFRNFSKDSHIFFLNLFCSLRTDFKTSFVKISKILKNLKLSKKFRTIFFPEGQKIMFFRNFSKDSQYFFLNVSAPLRKVFKTSFVKISKFLKNLKIFKKFRTIFFSEIFRPKNHVFQKFLERFSIFFSKCFASPQKSF